jgi:hypothetical protein
MQLSKLHKQHNRDRQQCCTSAAAKRLLLADTIEAFLTICHNPDSGLGLPLFLLVEIVGTYTSYNPCFAQLKGQAQHAMH